jgi:hypothetical protein
MNAELQDLKQKRLKWVESNRENGFDEGINRLLTELYPDNAHFIYELLQNAEDPQATEVQFKLTDSSVEFAHNGKRLFSFKDVESITSIGNSTKRDDATSIGKFGVGFKAVFAYTNTPEIHSGDFHFRIRDLVVPDTEGIKQSASNQPQTNFIFPFDNPKKPAEMAMQEIAKGLKALSDNSLLFLSHIGKIEYTLPDGAEGSLERIDQGNGRIDIRVCKPYNEATVSHWLHFQKDVEVTDDDGNTKTCRIAIAFSLVEEINKKTEEKIWKIIPLPHGQVSIYFPAEKETSNLKFHLHAPFASTVARDSVRDCQANYQLRDHLAELIMESLTTIRDQGLLTVSFLGVLPIPSDNLTVFYEPIRKGIVTAFQREALTPMKREGYAAADGVFKGPSSISDVIDDQDLVLLLGGDYEIPVWASNPPQRNQREDRFLESLDIQEWSWSELVNAIGVYDDVDIERINKWIEEKDDPWLMRLYALLGETITSHDEHVDAKYISIVRVSMPDGETGHSSPEDAYFPIENDEIEPPPDVLFVKSSVYLFGRSLYQKTYARFFLQSIGVHTYDLKTAVQHRLSYYENPPKEIKNSHFNDVKFFINFFKNNPTEKIIFKNKKFLIGATNQEKELFWSKPEQLYLDVPYMETGLAEIEANIKKKLVWSDYSKKLGENQLKDFVDFLEDLGVMVALKVEKVSLNNNPKTRELWKDFFNGARDTSTGINDDYSIIGIESYINRKSILCSKLIWLTLLGADAKVAKARYRPNQTYVVREADSQLIHHLKNNSWIPNKQGKFCKPSDMARDDLPRDFPYDDRNGLLTAIGFGENPRKRSEEYQAKNKKAQEMGFESAEQAAQFAELAKNGFSPEQWLAQQKSVEQPEKSVPNPDRRRKGLLERSENAPNKESVMRERLIQPGISTTQADAKAYLRAIYTNKNGEMVCQCCQKEMPFKIGGAYYFEAVQCLKRVKNQYIENRLALCPVCSAMYQHARHDDDEKVKTAILSINGEDAPAVEISIILAGISHRIRFVGTHWFDLRTIIGQA